MTCSILVGGAWGDEGKGKCITYLCNNDKPSIIARAGTFVSEDELREGVLVLYTQVPNS